MALDPHLSSLKGVEVEAWEEGCRKAQDSNHTRTLETKKKKKKKWWWERSNFLVAPISLGYYKPWFASCSILAASKARTECEETGLTVGLYYSRKGSGTKCSNFNKRGFESKRLVMTLITSLYQPCNDQPEDEETKAGWGSSELVIST